MIREVSGWVSSAYEWIKRRATHQRVSRITCGTWDQQTADDISFFVLLKQVGCMKLAVMDMLMMDRSVLFDNIHMLRLGLRLLGLHFLFCWSQRFRPHYLCCYSW